MYTHLRVGVYMPYMQPVAPLKFHVIMVYLYIYIYIYIPVYIYVTQSEKTGLISHVSRFDFSPRTQSYMNKLCNSTIKIS